MSDVQHLLDLIRDLTWSAQERDAMAEDARRDGRPGDAGALERDAAFFRGKREAYVDAAYMAGAEHRYVQAAAAGTWATVEAR